MRHKRHVVISNIHEYHHFIANTEQFGRRSPPASNNLSKSLPPRRRQHTPRQRNPPPINRGAPLADPLLRHGHRHQRLGLNHHPRPQQRRLDRQHPAHRPQNPRRLRSSLQQRHHLRLAENMAQLRPIPRRVPRSRPHQPAKPSRPSQRGAGTQRPISRHSTAGRCPSRTMPNPARLKPLQQPLQFPTDAAKPLKQQHGQRLAQPSSPTPAAHRPAHTADHGDQVRSGGGGCV